MRILHCCLSCFYIDNYNYQENVLPKINNIDGNEVEIVASTEVFVENSKIGYTEAREYKTKEGIKISRIPYIRYLPLFLSKKIRKYTGFKNKLDQFRPDVIMFHGTCAYDLKTAVNYKKSNNRVKLYVDSHEDYNNSATNFISKYFLHKVLYKSIIKKALPYIDKVFYITYESKVFLKEMYSIPEEKLEFYPLGGVIVNKEDKMKIKEKIRRKLNLNKEDILILHSGKIDKQKNTEELLKAFKKVEGDNLKLIIIGSIKEDIKNKIENLIKDDLRVTYLGWKESDELVEYLCASDLYVQPGSQSATMQNALCVNTPVMVTPVKSHKFLLKENAIYVETIEDMRKAFESIKDNKEILENIREESFNIAKEKLDYRKLARRLQN